MSTRVPSCLLFSLCLLFHFASVHAEEKPVAAEPPVIASGVKINMQDTNIRSFIEWIAKATGKNFIIDPRVTGKVTVISNEAMKPEEAYRVFLSVLQVHGFSAIESDSAVKVIPDANAKQSGVPLVDDDTLNDDQQVVRVIRTQHVPATQLVNILRPMVPQVGHLAAYPDSNALIISDRASNINQLLKLVSEIDRAGQFEIDVIPLKFANAKELSSMLGNIVPQGGGAEGSSKMNVSVDERTNSILISGDPSKRQQLRDVLTNLDRPGNIIRDTQVIYLHYLKASEVAQILQNVATSLQKQDKDVGISGAEISIQANDTTNALVISAPPAIMKTVEGVVQRLDIRRAQVLVEAVIVEVSENKVNELGVQWKTSDGAIGGNGFYGGFKSSLKGNTIDSFPGNQAKLDAGLSMGFYSNGSLRALIRALSTDDSMNILSTPNLVTLDNEEGKIVVGQNVPFVTGSSTSASNPSTNPFQTIERQDVGITLKIKPQINEGDSVTLNVYQEISSVTNDTSAADIVTNKRSVETRVLIKDNMTLVLGGLISDEVRDSGDKVPFLGKIPIIGKLFRSDRKEVSKKNLMVFIKPTIINDFDHADQLTEGKYNFIRERQLRYADQDIAKGVPTLPERINSAEKELKIESVPLLSQ
ncbi:type II secretion system secretin GspD [Metapseudomonas otitidis]|uniref:type II secretion system secretin GspD n=1 Tax=Metapseudomonas otitidis TaxID=319939 RepID=UPI0013F5FF1E|nr:type II secretion system secretin GspD [Pseudomonas otitidis]